VGSETRQCFASTDSLPVCYALRPPPRRDAKASHEFVDNYKLVQRVLQSKGVDKFVGAFAASHGGPLAAPPTAFDSLALTPCPVCPRCPPPTADVEKLVRAKHQDNLEFCQWLKSFFEKKCVPTS
jgi:hypothetical protein